MDSLFLVMPAYNEEDNIEKTVESWVKVLAGKSEKSLLVVADAGSTDSTHAILEKMHEKFPQVNTIQTERKEHGPKLLQLYKYAIDNGADYIFQTDSDGQTNPDEFESFWKLREEYDLVIGNRTERGDGKDRAFVEKIVCLLLKIYFGVNVPDANAPFRLMKTDIVKKYINLIPEDYGIPNIVFTAFFKKNNEKMTFKEISFKPRTAGTNSINIKKIVKIGMKSLGDFNQFRKMIK